MRKKIIFILFVVIFIVVVIEAFGFSFFYLIFDTPYSKKEIKNQIRLNANQSINIDSLRTDAAEILWGDQVEVLHPYLGFTQDPKRNLGVSSSGFPSLQANQYLKRDSHSIIIALMGGSFAREIYFLAGEQIVKSFSIYNKKVVLLNFAVGGYKQPQQLMALNYMLMSGAQFDIVINIDGFNEVALPLVENINYGVSPFYPRMWLNRVKNQYDPSEIRLIGKIESLKELKKSWAYFFNKHKLYRSPSFSLIWKFMDQKFDARIALANIDMRAFLNHAASFAATGPAYIRQTDEELYTDLAQIWFMSSILMHDICSANNIEYYHILQPNQYVPDSKTMSPIEIKHAYDSSHPYREPVIKGYPFLHKQAKFLEAKKVHFLDLTDIFLEHKETLYKDTCCHLNEDGYAIVVEKIVDYISLNTALKPQ